MKLKALLLTAFLAATLLADAGEQATASEEAKAKQVVEQFERGLNERKLELIEPIVAPDLVVFENGHRNDGWADFRDHHLVPEMKEPSPPSQREFVRIKMSGDIVWAYTKTTMRVKRANGDGADLLVWSIYVLEKRGGEWKLVLLDWSISSKRAG